MPADWLGRCTRNAEWRRCVEWHVRHESLPKRDGKYACPSCGEVTLTITDGKKGRRLVAFCDNGCSWPAISGGWLDHGLHHTCIGVPKPRPATPGMPSSTVAVTAEVVASEKKLESLMKLPLDMNLQLRLMCAQAIYEGDGELPPIPDLLLPVERKAFVALAKRAGIRPGSIYGLFNLWAADQHLSAA